MTHSPSLQYQQGEAPHLVSVVSQRLWEGTSGINWIAKLQTHSVFESEEGQREETLTTPTKAPPAADGRNFAGFGDDAPCQPL